MKAFQFLFEDIRKFPLVAATEPLEKCVSCRFKSQKENIKE